MQAEVSNTVFIVMQLYFLELLHMYCPTTHMKTHSLSGLKAQYNVID